jgi:hypothetical protein
MKTTGVAVVAFARSICSSSRWVIAAGAAVSSGASARNDVVIFDAPLLGSCFAEVCSVDDTDDGEVAVCDRVPDSGGGRSDRLLDELQEAARVVREPAGEAAMAIATRDDRVCAGRAVSALAWMDCVFIVSPFSWLVRMAGARHRRKDQRTLIRRLLLPERLLSR